MRPRRAIMSQSCCQAATLDEQEAAAATRESYIGASRRNPPRSGCQESNIERNRMTTDNKISSRATRSPTLQVQQQQQQHQIATATVTATTTTTTTAFSEIIRMISLLVLIINLTLLQVKPSNELQQPQQQQQQQQQHEAVFHEAHRRANYQQALHTRQHQHPQLPQRSQSARGEQIILPPLTPDQPQSAPLTTSSLNNNNNNNSPDAPKLIPLSALDRYQEGTDLRLFCSASAPRSGGRFHFEWLKNQNELLNGRLTSSETGQESVAQHQNNNNKQATSAANDSSRQRLQISMMDESASLLRITQLDSGDSGNYTCLVRNQQGFDSSTVRVNVMVKLKWIIEPPNELQVRAGKFVQLECDASAQPAPLISWTSLKDYS